MDVLVCGGVAPKTQTEFIEQAQETHGNLYDYSETIYNGSKGFVTIICKDHGRFSQRADCHIGAGQGCPSCYNKTEGKFTNWMTDLGVEFIPQFKVVWCKSKKTGYYYPFDYYLPRSKTIIEIDGPQHFKQIGNWPSPDKIKKSIVIKKIVLSRMAFV